eukprot:6174362-Pleurochrysis_carterae.AAC.1
MVVHHQPVCVLGSDFERSLASILHDDGVGLTVPCISERIRQGRLCRMLLAALQCAFLQTEPAAKPSAHDGKPRGRRLLLLLQERRLIQFGRQILADLLLRYARDARSTSVHGRPLVARSQALRAVDGLQTGGRHYCKVFRPARHGASGASSTERAASVRDLTPSRAKGHGLVVLFLLAQADVQSHDGAEQGENNFWVGLWLHEVAPRAEDSAAELVRAADGVARIELLLSARRALADEAWVDVVWSYHAQQFQQVHAALRIAHRERHQVSKQSAEQSMASKGRLQTP